MVTCNRCGHVWDVVPIGASSDDPMDVPNCCDCLTPADRAELVLTSIIYELVRDHLPAGVLNALFANEVKMWENKRFVEFSDEYLREWAESWTKKLLGLPTYSQNLEEDLSSIREAINRNVTSWYDTTTDKNTEDE